MRKLLYILLLCIVSITNTSCNKSVQNYILDKNTKDTIASFLFKEDIGYIILADFIDFDDKEQIKYIARLLKAQELHTEKNDFGTNTLCKIYRYNGSFTDFELYKREYSPYDYKYFISIEKNEVYENIYDKWDRKEKKYSTEKQFNKILKGSY